MPMKEMTIENIQVQNLPPAWGQKLNASPSDLVNVSIRLAAPSRRKFDRGAVERLLNSIDAMPVLDNRTAEEIVQYNDIGLPA